MRKFSFPCNCFRFFAFILLVIFVSGTSWGDDSDSFSQGLSVFSASNGTVRPVAVPVLTLDEAEEANKTAERIKYRESLGSFEYVPMSPVAVPVLSPEQAEEANKTAKRIWKKVLLKNEFYNKISRIVIFLQNNSLFVVIVALLPFLLFMGDIALPPVRKRIERVESGYFSLQRRFFVFSAVNLLVFGLIVFVPWSIYFGNSSQFPFIFQDFYVENVVVFSLLAIFLTGLLLIIPHSIGDYIAAGLAGGGLGIYIQSMFMNYNLGEMDGTNIDLDHNYIRLSVNAMIWGIIILSPFVLNRFIRKYWKIIVSSISGAVFLLEAVAVISMLLGAPARIWNRDTNYFCNGSKQFQFSKEKNIIVFVFDALGSGFVNYCLEETPEYKEMLKDFIWFSDARSNYRTTFPGLHHELTGTIVQPANSQRDLFYQSWHSPSAKSFYKQIKDAGFDPRFYINDQGDIGSFDLYNEYFSNIEQINTKINIDKKKLFDCVARISCFSAFPYCLKKFYYYDSNTYSDIVTQEATTINNSFVPRTNDRYYTKMMQTPFTTDSSSPVISFHYTTGAHPVWFFDEKCVRNSTPYSDPLPTIRSCFYIVSNFIRFLKEKDIYNQTAILIISDHGSKSGVRGKKLRTPFDMTFMIKPFNRNHSEIVLDSSKVQSIDVLPTLLQVACDEKADFSDFEGFSAFGIPAERERIVYMTAYHPEITSFLYEKNGQKCGFNCLKEFSFVDVDSFSETNSFLRYIPLNINAKADKKTLHTLLPDE